MAMKRITKRYESDFVADKSKLTRLVSVIQSQFNEKTPQLFEQYTASLSSDKTFETNSLTDVFELDNSENSRIHGLRITCGSAPKDAASANEGVADFTDQVSVHFDTGTFSTGASISV